MKDNILFAWLHKPVLMYTVIDKLVVVGFGLLAFFIIILISESIRKLKKGELNLSVKAALSWIAWLIIFALIGHLFGAMVVGLIALLT